MDFAARTVFADKVSGAAPFCSKYAPLESKVEPQLASLRLAPRPGDHGRADPDVQKRRASPLAEEADIFAENPSRRQSLPHLRYALDGD